MKKLFLFPFFIGSIVYAQVHDSGDKVGVGTTTPSEKLEVNGGLRISNPDTNESWRLIPNHDSSFSIKETGFSGSFNIYGNGSANVNLMNLKDGKVGIGTTSPLAKLHVNGGMMLDQGIIQKGGTPITNTTDLGLYSHLLGHWIRIVSNNAPIRFFTGIGSGGVGNDTKMSIEANGNIGIGTTSPDSKLEVNGDITVGNSTTVGSYINIIGAGNNQSFGLQLGSAGNTDGKASILSHTTTGNLSFSVQENLAMTINSSGNIGIGTTDTKGFKLGVNGKIAATEVKVATYTNWPDYVFNKDYILPTLKEVEKHIEKEGHLKNIPNAKEVKKHGIFLGDMDSKLLQKIEELTLYTIDQEKSLEEKDLKIKSLEERLKRIEALLLKN